MKSPKKVISPSNVSELIPKQRIKNLKISCQHNQNLGKTNFLINLKRIGIITTLSYLLLNVIIRLLIVFLTEIKEVTYIFDKNITLALNIWQISYNSLSNHAEKVVELIMGIWLIFLSLFFIIKNVWEIKMIKKHQATKLNCQKLDQQIHTAIRTFKEITRFVVYLWFCALGMFIFQLFFNLEWLVFLVSLIYFLIGLSCIYFLGNWKEKG